MHSNQTHDLVVWGEHLRLEGFRRSELDELFEWFAGSVELVAGRPVPSLVVRILRSTVSAPQSLHSIPRHRGGVSGVKYFLDGSCFDQAPQYRDVDVLLESPAMCCYVVDGALLATTREVAMVIALEPPPMLLADLLENWLLWRAREAGSVMAHGSGWSRDNAVEILVGPSGVGKTSELFRQMKNGGEFFSNDRIALRLQGDVLLARNFPQPINVGCGTIRELGMNLPTFDLDDHCKIRLMPPEVLERWKPAYEHWYPVKAIFSPSLESLEENVYWDGDPDHPFWNAALRPRVLTERSALEQAIQTRLVIGMRDAPAAITNE